MEEKKEIRKKIFKARKEHTDAWIRENSLRITEALTQLPEYRNAERIMAYADYNHEVIQLQCSNDIRGCRMKGTGPNAAVFPC